MPKKSSRWFEYVWFFLFLLGTAGFLYYVIKFSIPIPGDAPTS